MERLEDRRLLTIGPDNLSNGVGLSTYRLALATTVEFTEEVCRVSTVCDSAGSSDTVKRSVAGDAVDQILAAVNEVYRRELAIQFDLVRDNDLLLSVGDPASDGYTDNQTSVLYFENASVIQSRLGSGSIQVGQPNEYDLGHVLALNASGGLAGLGVVGGSGRAQGVSSISTPVELDGGNQVVPTDPLLSILLHEIGHQFGAEHTFNGVDQNCATREIDSSWEPGSGSTIMAYQGICGSDNLPVEDNDERYFHAGSFDEIQRYISTYIPDLRPPVATGNSIPTVDAGGDYVIPAGTPFALTANASDPDPGDQLTYTWEQIDTGANNRWGLTRPLTSGGVSATTSTSLNALDRQPDEYSFLTGDALPITGTRPDGTAVSASYSYTAGDTVQHFLDAINAAFGSGDPGGATATLAADGKILLTANAVNQHHPQFSIQVDSSGPPQLMRFQFISLGEPVPIDDASDAVGPLFRSFAPSSTPTRVFPRLSDIVAGTDPASNRGEHLPTQSRMMNFRATVRDNHFATDRVVSGVHSDDVQLQVVDTGAAFQITAPNTAVNWEGGSTQTITWNVAGTDANGIDTATVNVRLSTDGGVTFPIVLGNFANDGTADIAVPHLAGGTSAARLLVEAAGNVFFDVSDQDFTINASSAAGVSIRQTAGNALWEDPGIVTAQYQVALNTAPAAGGNVSLRVSADGESQVSLTGEPGSFATSQTLVLSSTAPRTVYVRALDDIDVEGPHTTALRHLIVASDDAANYPTSMEIPAWVPTIVDNDEPPPADGDGVLIGVDFGPGGDSNPTNWTGVTTTGSFAAVTLENLVNENGQATDVDLEFVRISGGGTSTPTSGSIPTHSQSLAALDGVLYSGSFGGVVEPIDVIWDDLTPGAAYEVYVFALENFADTFDQRVTILGEGPAVSFNQVTSNGTLLINDETGSSGRSLQSYAETIRATAYGTIRIRVEADNGSPGLVVPGVAIREIIPSTKITSINGNSSQDEGSDSGNTTPFDFTVTRSGAIDSAATVNYSVVGIGGNPVDATDFGGTLPSGQVQFLAGQATSETVRLNLVADAALEGDERLLIRLSSPSDGAQLDADSFAVTITNDDQPPPPTATRNTIGLYQPDVSLFHLKNSFTPGASDQYFAFGPGGNAGWIPLVGDWNGDGIDTIGLYQPDISLFHLKDSFTPGGSDQYFAFGPGGGGWVPLAGDWNGDGIDTIGLYQPDQSIFHLKDSFAAGNSDHYFAYGPGGNAGWIPLTGDWNGDGTDTVGLYQPDVSLFHLKNTLATGGSDQFFAFGPGGNAGWTPMVGDWNRDGTDTIGLYQGDISLFHLKDSFTPGASDQYFAFGPGGSADWIPLSGDWDGPETSPPSQARPAALIIQPSPRPAASDDNDEQAERETLSAAIPRQPSTSKPLRSPSSGSEPPQRQARPAWQPVATPAGETKANDLAAIDLALRLLTET